MKPQTIQLAPLDLRAAVETVNDGTRTVNLVFSTGADVIRYDWDTGERYVERLSMDPKAVRLDRLNSGAPLLDSHSSYSLSNVIGAVEDGSAKLDGKVGTAAVRFSKRADVEPFYQDVKDKIIRNVSVGYRVYRFEEDDNADNKMPVRLATDWEPFEISMVPMGADMLAQTRSGRPGVRLRTSQEVETHPCVLVTRAMELAAVTDADRRRRLRLAMARN